MSICGGFKSCVVEEMFLQCPIMGWTTYFDLTFILFFKRGCGGLCRGAGPGGHCRVKKAPVKASRHLSRNGPLWGRVGGVSVVGDVLASSQCALHVEK